MRSMKDEDNLKDELVLSKRSEEGFWVQWPRLKEKGPFNKFEPRLEKDERIEIQCYECGGVGHFAPDGGNLKNKKKGKVMAATWSRSDDSN